jgi:hypothetical protein
MKLESLERPAIFSYLPRATFADHRGSFGQNVADHVEFRW